MPKVKEAAVAVTGLIVDIDVLNDFTTKLPDGSLRVLLSTGDGFASVKIASEDRAAAGEVNFGSQVGYVVRYGAYAREGSDAQATCRFIRHLSENDLDKLVSVGAPKSGK